MRVYVCVCVKMCVSVKTGVSFYYVVFLVRQILFIFPRDRVFVNGAIRYDEFTDAEDNIVRTTTILASKYTHCMGMRSFS